MDVLALIILAIVVGLAGLAWWLNSRHSEPVPVDQLVQDKKLVIHSDGGYADPVWSASVKADPPRDGRW